jgi:hypothetical protein
MFYLLRVRKNLEQVQDYEEGPTYRISLWFQVVQQLAKATLVSCDSAPFTKAMGTLYLFSFLPIEGCLLRARTPLTFELKQWNCFEMGKGGAGPS